MMRNIFLKCFNTYWASRTDDLSALCLLQMMRNIFLKCFNTYKGDGESSLSDSFALKHMKFSPRLFEVKLSQRVETAAYIQDTDTFVVAEGEAARCYNIHTGESGTPHTGGRGCYNIHTGEPVTQGAGVLQHPHR